jgi:hypothetical protein
MRIITKRSRWGRREFIVINRWPGPRWSRHQQTCGTVTARVGHSKRIHLSELSFRTIEGACSRLLPSHAVLGEWSPPRSPSTHLCTDRRLHGRRPRWRFPGAHYGRQPPLSSITWVGKSQERRSCARYRVLQNLCWLQGPRRLIELALRGIRPSFGRERGAPGRSGIRRARPEWFGCVLS